MAQVDVQVTHLCFIGLHRQPIARAGDTAIIAHHRTVGPLYHKCVGHHGLCHALEYLVHIIILRVHRLPIAYHVDILLSDDKPTGVIQFRMRVAKAQRILRHVRIGAACLLHLQVGVHHESPAQVVPSSFCKSAGTPHHRLWPGTNSSHPAPTKL